MPSLHLVLADHDRSGSFIKRSMPRLIKGACALIDRPLIVDRSRSTISKREREREQTQLAFAQRNSPPTLSRPVGRESCFSTIQHLETGDLTEALQNGSDSFFIVFHQRIQLSGQPRRDLYISGDNLLPLTSTFPFVTLFSATDF